MPIQCIICLQPLIAGGDHSAAIPCGHVYHKNCLRPWVNENRNCPLCKKACNHRQIISPLYLSSDDDNDGNLMAESSEQAQNMQLRIISLTKEKETATQNLNTAKQALQEERVKSQEIASDLRGATKAIRHMKQIRRVAELDDLMSSPTSVAFFQNLESYSKDELLLQNRAMQSRLKKAHSERDDAVRKASLLERENLHLLKKNERLQEKLQRAESKGVHRPVEPRPRRGNVIVLDSDDGDSDGEITLDDDDDSDTPVLIGENSNRSNNHSRRNPDHPSLKRHHSLLSDNDDDFAVEEHRIPDLGHLNLSRWT